MLYPNSIFKVTDLVPDFTFNYQKQSSSSFRFSFVAHNFNVATLEINYLNGILTIKTNDLIQKTQPNFHKDFPDNEKFWVNFELPFKASSINVSYDGLVLYFDCIIGEVATNIQNLSIVQKDVEHFGLPKHIEKIKDYVYLLEYDLLDYNLANAETDTLPFSCTSTYKDGIFGRNFDLTYTNSIEAIVKTPHTICVCGGIHALTEKRLMDNTYDKNDLKSIPFNVRDGINSKGLCCSINSVHSLGNTKSEPNIVKKHSVNAIKLCRFILDRFETAKEACEFIANYVEIIFADNIDYETHYLIADKTSAYWLEVIDNKVVYGKFDNKPAVVTNFHYYNVTFDENNKVATPSTIQRQIIESETSYFDENVEPPTDELDIVASPESQSEVESITENIETPTDNLETETESNGFTENADEVNDELDIEVTNG